MKLLLLAVVVFFQTEVPFKNSDEFVVEVKIKFKEKPVKFEQNTYAITGERLDKSASTQVAFLSVDISQLKILEDESRIAVVNETGAGILKKKTSPVPELHFDFGFVDEIKASKSTKEITVLFLSAEKKQLRKIVCTILADGTFQVNGKWHGQF